MDDQSQTPTVISTTSGGVGVNSECAVNIGGNVAGRDHITQNTQNIYYLPPADNSAGLNLGQSQSSATNSTVSLTTGKSLQYDFWDTGRNVLTFHDVGKALLASKRLEIELDTKAIEQPFLNRVGLQIRNNGQAPIIEKDLLKHLVLVPKGKTEILCVKVIEQPNPPVIGKTEKTKVGQNYQIEVISPWERNGLVKMEVYLTGESSWAMPEIRNDDTRDGKIPVSKRPISSWDIFLARRLLLGIGLPCGGLWLLSRIVEVQPDLVSRLAPIGAAIALFIAGVVVGRISGNRRKSSDDTRPQSQA